MNKLEWLTLKRIFFEKQTFATTTLEKPDFKTNTLGIVPTWKERLLIHTIWNRRIF